MNSVAAVAERGAPSNARSTGVSMASHQDVDSQIFLGATSEKKTLENREGFPSLSFIAAPRGATRDVPSVDETEAPPPVASDYVAIASSE
jgi:hypothetical protein